MATIARNKLLRASRLLHGERTHGSKARLATLMGVSSQTVKGWLAEPGADHQREMSGTARRLLSVLVYCQAKGLLTDGDMDKIRDLEQHLIAGQGRLDRFLDQLLERKRTDDDDDD